MKKVLIAAAGISALFMVNVSAVETMSKDGMTKDNMSMPKDNMSKNETCKNDECKSGMSKGATSGDKMGKVEHTNKEKMAKSDAMSH
jgi:hypothetical protein